MLPQVTSLLLVVVYQIQHLVHMQQLQEVKLTQPQVYIHLQEAVDVVEHSEIIQQRLAEQIISTVDILHF